MALRGAYVDPADHARELRSLVGVLGRGPTLVLFHDDFYQYELLPVPTTSPPMPSPTLAAPFSAQKPWQYGSPIDFDSVDPATLDRFDHVITVRTAYQSEPPPNFRLERHTRSYDVWRRVGRTPPRRLLPEAGAPGAVLDCHRRWGRDIARAHGVARVRVRPIVQLLDWGLRPGDSFRRRSRFRAAPGSCRFCTRARSLFASPPDRCERPCLRISTGRVPSGGSVTFVEMVARRPSRSLRNGRMSSLLRQRSPLSGRSRQSSRPADALCRSRSHAARYVDWYRVTAGLTSFSVPADSAGRTD